MGECSGVVTEHGVHSHKRNRCIGAVVHHVRIKILTGICGCRPIDGIAAIRQTGNAGSTQIRCVGHGIDDLHNNVHRLRSGYRTVIVCHPQQEGINVGQLPTRIRRGGQVTAIGLPLKNNLVHGGNSKDACLSRLRNNGGTRRIDAPRIGVIQRRSQLLTQGLAIDQLRSKRRKQLCFGGHHAKFDFFSSENTDLPISYRAIRRINGLNGIKTCIVLNYHGGRQIGGTRAGLRDGRTTGANNNRNIPVYFGNHLAATAGFNFYRRGISATDLRSDGDVPRNGVELHARA